MTPDGRVVDVQKFDGELENYNAVSEIIRFSPRRTVLQPGESQKVRLLVRRLSSMRDGEYRGHFVVSEEPYVEKLDPEDLKDVSQAEQRGEPKDSMEVGVGLTLGQGFPVYVLHGETNAAVTIASAKLVKEGTKSFIAYSLQHEGNRSVIYEANVYCANSSGESQIAKGKLDAVYAEASSRDNRVLIDIPQAGCRSLRLAIEAYRDDLLAGQLLSQVNIAQ